MRRGVADWLRSALVSAHDCYLGFAPSLLFHLRTQSMVHACAVACVLFSEQPLGRHICTGTRARPFRICNGTGAPPFNGFVGRFRFGARRRAALNRVLSCRPCGPSRRRSAAAFGTVGSEGHSRVL